MNKQNTKEVLKKYCKYIVHMREQYHTDQKKLGIVIGAGTSKEIGFPDWNELVKRISESPEMKCFHINLANGKDAISNAQLLFQLFKAKEFEGCCDTDLEYNRIEMKVRSNWQRIVHEALYRDISETVYEFIPTDHYLWNFIKIVKNIPMTINYNFDDSLQRMLLHIRTDEEKEYTRGYSTIWNTNVYMYPKNSVIYHPNGFLPRNINEHPSEQLVFLEDSFADQLIDSQNGHYNVLTNYFSHNSCLLIGLSLNDPTIKHILRQHSQRFPGHCHYYIHYIEEDEVVPNKQAIVDSNFEVYNLITLFLNGKEINALSELISMTDESFQCLVEEQGLFNIYKYYIVGSVAVGKSTALSQFRMFSTQDEWLEPMPQDMAKDPSKVDDKNINLIDKWIADQVGKKNFKLSRCRSGIHVIDRCPLDAFAFTPLAEWKEKAKLLRSKVSPGEAKSRKLCPACVILLTGDPKVMAARALATHRDTDSEKLARQQSLLINTYCRDGKNYFIIDTKNKGKNQVAKEIAKLIYLKEYQEAPLDDWLFKYETGEFQAPKEDDLKS